MEAAWADSGDYLDKYVYLLWIHRFFWRGTCHGQIWSMWIMLRALENQSEKSACQFFLFSFPLKVTTCIKKRYPWTQHCGLDQSILKGSCAYPYKLKFCYVLLTLMSTDFLYFWKTNVRLCWPLFFIYMYKMVTEYVSLKNYNMHGPLYNMFTLCTIFRKSSEVIK